MKVRRREDKKQVTCGQSAAGKEKREESKEEEAEHAGQERGTERAIEQ